MAENSSSSADSYSFVEIPELPNSQAYVNEINKIFADLRAREPEAEELTQKIFMLIGMAKAAKKKMELENKNKVDIDFVMDAIGSLQIKAFGEK
ncbi:hypothetical protein L5515_005160 [Caenorhabditis briggsae]|uniref:Uncharacterized protein n=1 Tax=Caenorhabditis briggsae TaxID=6238 RepID=A0AAE9EJJ4_CAEBR|nr:hypothetical protein L5515_005160 [Caenorhabditis briggsae]